MAPAMVKKFGPLVGMLYVQVAYGAMFLLTRFALTHGMSHYAFVLYRQLIASIAIFPAAYFLNSSMQLSTFSWKNVMQIFFLALFGTSISQNFYYAGLALTSSTFASTMNNLQPAITFLLAYLLKLEEVKIKSWEGQAKVVGTLVCVGGAVVMTLSKVHSDKGLHEVLKLVVHGEESGAAFIFGAILTVIGSSSWSLFVIYQMTRMYTTMTRRDVLRNRYREAIEDLDYDPYHGVLGHIGKRDRLFWKLELQEFPVLDNYRIWALIRSLPDNLADAARQFWGLHEGRVSYVQLCTEMINYADCEEDPEEDPVEDFGSRLVRSLKDSVSGQHGLPVSVPVESTVVESRRRGHVMITAALGLVLVGAVIAYLVY